MEMEKITFTTGREYSDISKAVKDFHDLTLMLKKLENEKDRLKGLIVTDMGGAESKDYKSNGVTFQATNKAITSTRVDTKALKAKYPKIAEEVSTTTTSPRFTVK